MTFDDQIASLKRSLAASLEHAQSYRNLYFDMIDAHDKLRDELDASKRIRKQQRQVIADLEARLGIDPEL